MTKEEAKSIFTLAGIPIATMWELPNGYLNPRYCLDRWKEHGGGTADRLIAFAHEAEDALRSPWWLVKTPWGLVKIGWSDTPFVFDPGDLEKITTDDVTKDAQYIHAWSVAKAVEYPTNWRKLAEKETAEALA